MSISVILSAYANAGVLRKVLLGYRVQTLEPDMMLIAEDGESPDIRQLVEDTRRDAPWPLQHLTQAHHGFRKCRILNQAIAAAPDGLVIFSDGDCIPRADFVARHAALWRPGRFMAGGSHLNVPMSFHEHALGDAMILDQSIFDHALLRTIPDCRAPRLRLLPAGPLARVLDVLTQRNAFVGCNSSVARADLLRVAGFDESLGYGGADVNLGIRLNNAGIRGVRARHSLVCLHLDHARQYNDPAERSRIKAINQSARRDGRIEPAASSLTQR